MHMDKADAPEVIDETYWSNPDKSVGISKYAKSKTFAEKAIWDF